MRCINTRTGELELYPTDTNPGYAILSHRWEDEEITFEDMTKGSAHCQSKKGHRKLARAVQQAQADGLEYVWIDTCCINKDSSHELAEAINSMFAWYAEAVICYAYLADVVADDAEKTLEKSVWFTRGWTLQELLAPHDVESYDADWTSLGTKRQLAEQVSHASGIDIPYLKSEADFFLAPIAQRMSWASRRNTARLEDQAYSLLGIFRINMTMNYGEGSGAFTRLQIALIERYPDDPTIFAWTGVTDECTSLLAPSPACFEGSGRFEVNVHNLKRDLAEHQASRPVATMRHISISFTMCPYSDGVYSAHINCLQPSRLGRMTIRIFLGKCQDGTDYKRLKLHHEDLIMTEFFGSPIIDYGGFRRTITVPLQGEKSSASVPVRRRLSRIARSELTRGIGETPQIVDMEQQSNGELDERPRKNLASFTGFGLSIICGTFLDRWRVRVDTPIKWNGYFFTANAGDHPFMGTFCSISHPQTRGYIEFLRLGIDRDFRPCLILAERRALRRLAWRRRLASVLGCLQKSWQSSIDKDDPWLYHPDGQHEWDNNDSHGERGVFRATPVVQPGDGRRGIWLLKGHHTDGLSVCAATLGKKQAVLIDVQRKTVGDQSVWVVRIKLGACTKHGWYMEPSLAYPVGS